MRKPRIWVQCSCKTKICSCCCSLQLKYRIWTTIIKNFFPEFVFNISNIINNPRTFSNQTPIKNEVTCNSHSSQNGVSKDYCSSENKTTMVLFIWRCMMSVFRMMMVMKQFGRGFGIRNHMKSNYLFLVFWSKLLNLKLSKFSYSIITSIGETIFHSFGVFSGVCLKKEEEDP